MGYGRVHWSSRKKAGIPKYLFIIIFIKLKIYIRASTGIYYNDK